MAGANATVDWSAGGDGPVLLYTAARQKSKLVEHKRLPQSKTIRHTGRYAASITRQS